MRYVLGVGVILLAPGDERRIIECSKAARRGGVSLVEVRPEEERAVLPDGAAKSSFNVLLAERRMIHRTI